MINGGLEKLSIEHIRIYESFEKKEKCALCRCIENFRNQQCFCFKHNKLLTNAAKEKFNKRDFEVFKEEITNVQMKYCKELENDLEWFINKFDYRYVNEPWYNAKDSIYRAREILRRDNI